MHDIAIQEFKYADAAILCAAVADFRPVKVASEKIKRKGPDLDIHLVANPDIAAELGIMKKEHQLLVGFALETSDEQHNAEAKLEKKNLDFIVLNSLRNEGTCFQSNDNQISIISRNEKIDFEKKSKQDVACDIVDAIVKRLR